MNCGLWGGPATVVCWIHILKPKLLPRPVVCTPSPLGSLLPRLSLRRGQASCLRAAAPRQCRVCDCRATAVAMLHGAHHALPCPAARAPLRCSRSLLLALASPAALPLRAHAHARSLRPHPHALSTCARTPCDFFHS